MYINNILYVISTPTC